MSLQQRSTARRSYLGDMWWHAIKLMFLVSLVANQVSSYEIVFTSQGFCMEKYGNEVDLSVETPEIQMGKMGVSWLLGHCNERNPSQMESFSIWHKYLIRSTRLWITTYPWKARNGSKRIVSKVGLWKQLVGVSGTQWNTDQIIHDFETQTGLQDLNFVPNKEFPLNSRECFLQIFFLWAVLPLHDHVP